MYKTSNANLNDQVKGGEIVFFQHGLFCDAKSFHDAVDTFKSDNRFIYGGILTTTGDDYNKSILPHISDELDFNIAVDTLSISFKLSFKEKVDEMISLGKYVMFKTQFQDNNGPGIAQRRELAKIISEFCPDNRKTTLVGHSRGGIINADYTTSNPEKVKKLISLGSPYHKNSAAMLSHMIGYKDGEGVDELAGLDNDYLDRLKQNWNNGNIGMKVKSIALACFWNDFSDGVVSIVSQMAGGYKGILAKVVNPIEPESIFHTEEPSNPKAISVIKEQILSDSYRL